MEDIAMMARAAERKQCRQIEATAVALFAARANHITI